MGTVASTAGSQTAYIAYGNAADQHVFGPFRNVAIHGEDVYDEAGRVVTHVRYSLTVREIIATVNETGTANAVETLRRRLSKPGKTLIIVGLGFGNLVVNGDGTELPSASPDPVRTNDVEWGPKPKMHPLKPIGGALAWELVWTCEFSIPHCTSAPTQSGKFLALNYRLAYQRDDRGLTTRVIRGYFTIPQTRWLAGSDSGTNVRAFAEDLWGRITFAVPFMFRRVSSAHETDLSKNRVDFHVTDAELTGNPYPAGIIDGDLEESVSVQAVADKDGNPGAVTQGMPGSYTLSGELEVAPGQHPALAMKVFAEIVSDRMAHIVDGTTSSAIPQNIHASHSLFKNSRTTKLSATWFVTQPFSKLLGSPGIWRPYAPATYNNWLIGVIGRHWSNRGYGDVTRTTNGNGNSNNEDVLIELCDNNPSTVTLGNDVVSHPEANVEFSLPGLTTLRKEDSYLYWRNAVWDLNYEEITFHKPAQEVQARVAAAVAVAAGAGALGGVGAAVFGALSGESSPAVQGQGQEDTAQTQGTPERYVIMVGRCVRAGYLPEIPTLRQVGQNTVQELRRTIEQPHVIDNWLGLSIYGASWQIVYKVMGLAAVPIEPPPNKATEKNDQDPVPAAQAPDEITDEGFPFREQQGDS